MAAAFAAVSLSAAEPQTSTREAVNYGRAFEPHTRPALLALPPGAVEPAGWLHDWCLAARDGYTGHMDDFDVEFKRAWAVDHTMRGERLAWPRGAWPYEGGGYWFDGLARLGYVLHDDALLQQAKRRFDVVVNHMNPNSILFLWWLNKNRPDDVKAITCDGGWPIWACGLLGRGMAAYYAGSGDRRVLQTLEAGYRGDRNWVRLPGGMSSVWPAFQTYTWTGNKEIAEGLNALFSKADGQGACALAGSDTDTCQTRSPGPRPTTTAWRSLKARRLGRWATCGPVTASSSMRRLPGTTCWNTSRCSPPACLSWMSSTDPPARFGERRPVTWPATCGVRSSC